MKAYLVLEDGFYLEGKSFTGEFESTGEVIFNTAMTGYQEVLTDPSYTGQMVCMTYPLIGNYGINDEDMESSKIHVAAMIVKECCKVPSNFRATESLPEFLIRQNIAGIEDIDTRALTLHLRDNGALRGIISTKTSNIEELVQKAKSIPSMEGQNLVPLVAPDSPYIWKEDKPQKIKLNADGSHNWEGDKPKVVVYDFGIKWNILRLLTSVSLDLLVVPPTFTAADVEKTGAEAIFLSNGPGDPATLKNEIEQIKKLTEKYPMAGICLGHQLLGLALGAKTEKIRFGHHGANNPVKDLTTGHIEISSQNHGFVVIPTDELEVTHLNLNDNSIEGFKHKTKPIIAVQHHPEAAPGPTDSRSFFHQFRQLLKDKLGR